MRGIFITYELNNKEFLIVNAGKKIDSAGEATNLGVAIAVAVWTLILVAAASAIGVLD